jgi:[glutamine synthetase] adenylyltransferase / [glutamine synthetase]-adenylyl-L-tyrosine phosphorylase
MELNNIIAQTADPEVTLNRLQTLLKIEQATQVFNLFSDEQKSGLIQILGISRFLFNFLYRHPDAISLIGIPYQTTGTINISDVNELRLYKYRCLLQITWMDVCNTCPYETVLFNLSHLADSILQSCHALVTKESNEFKPNIDIAIMALGKLGANELNYSSDVDLVFVLRNCDMENRHDMYEYYTRHIQKFCRLLSEKSEDGFLYRVDLNLRPWGRSAPLVFSLDDTEQYYQASKEAWERIAWLRGRVVAGSKELGSELISRLKPFVFHKALGDEDVKRFLKIKKDMAGQRKKEGHWNIKLGEGGIRDIEFFIQLLQIINGAHHPDLQITNTIKTLRCLKNHGIINNEESIELEDSYLFLRRVENRLQMFDEQQTHQLPHDEQKLKHFALMMGYKSKSVNNAYTGFRNDLLLHQRIAKKYFDKLLTENVDLSLSDNPIESALANAWHQDAASNSLNRWQELSVKENWKMAVKSQALMVTLFGASWYFTRFCFYRGDKIISLFDKNVQTTMIVESSLNELKNFPMYSSLDDAVEQLSIRKNEIMLSILLLQLGHVIEQEEAELLLTRLAENVLFVMCRLFGLDQFKDIQYIVLAMGRFAGCEMNYGSDLDLIFIEKKMSPVNDEHMANKIRTMLRYISLVNPSGRLYEIDMRLRPHGNSGTLVTPLDSFLKFHQSEREIWERQMMTRGRVVIGDKELSEQVIKEISDNVYGKYEVSWLAKEIMKVRLLVEQELAAGKDNIEIKRGKGGIMDVDFITHFLQLTHGSDFPQLRNSSTRLVLKESSSLGFISEKEKMKLLDAYNFYKKSEAALRVFDMKSTSKVSKYKKSLLPLARALGFVDTNHDEAVKQYQDKLAQYRNDVRQIFESIVI